MTEREAIYAMKQLERFGPAAYDRLIAFYGSAEAAWRDPNPPLTGWQLEEWEAWHREGREAELLAGWHRLREIGCRFLIREDREFPVRLTQIPNAPFGLFVIGEFPEDMSDAVAMVGARTCSPYGKNMALRIGKELGERGIPVVSGMAAGIDACSHWGALEGKGPCAAVLGSGIDVIFPASNRSLYRELAERGVILSEYGPGVPGKRFHFPLRNRLISGLSRVVLVMEARARSGSLITADMALEQGRDVLALPGRVEDPLSAGCLQLIRQGAGILIGVQDVLRALGRDDGGEDELEIRTRGGGEGLPAKDRRIYDLLTSVPQHQDVLAVKSGIPVSELFEILWRLESKGLCRQASVGTYMKK